MLKKRNTTNIDQAVAAGVNFEITVADLARRSERRAWLVASCASGVALVLAGGYLAVMPLKEKVPFLVVADPYSGTSSLARLTDDVVNRQITASEAINRSNVAHFVLAREAYDLALTNLRDWPTVLTMAAPDVAQPYMELHATNNESSPYRLYGKHSAIRVKILSIVLIGGEHGQTPTGATVRFQRSVYDKTTGGTYPLDSKIATIAFAYKANLRMDDQNRIENPLGFQITSYRVDNDYGSTAPAEVAAPRPRAESKATPTIPADTEAGDATIPPSPLAVEAGYPAPSTSTPPPAIPVTPTAVRRAANGGHRQ
ncbi:type IV secretion system protein VirB8 [Luteibacter sp. UNCMF331Sha3.1]|uniref:virB8 family protein n=1 Tax=Luteibacter sp. UNCMF331Sha3.1 TaxID=1502760 RepID=UPI0008BAA42C|nr:type IV secretion system protein [Luteibacter sp. UNCMF331Sha3.1]SEM96460.1 type IV secretion system protein VirB8 [Luteibacter sp. UNCMF331Sha3.1]